MGLLILVRVCVWDCIRQNFGEFCCFRGFCLLGLTFSRFGGLAVCPCFLPVGKFVIFVVLRFWVLGSGLFGCWVRWLVGVRWNFLEFAVLWFFAGM